MGCSQSHCVATPQRPNLSPLLFILLLSLFSFFLCCCSRRARAQLNKSSYYHHHHYPAALPHPTGFSPSARSRSLYLSIFFFSIERELPLISSSSPLHPIFIQDLALSSPSSYIHRISLILRPSDGSKSPGFKKKLFISISIYRQIDSSSLCGDEYDDTVLLVRCGDE